MTWSKLSRDPAGFLWEAINTRGLRLTLYVVVTAVLFPSSRFLLAVVLAAALGVTWTRDFARGRNRNIVYWLIALAAIAGGYWAAATDVLKVDEMRQARNPWGDGIILVADGTYTGSGQGYRGPIEVEVTVENHRIESVKLLKYPDLISVLDNELAAYRREILEKGRLEPVGRPQMLRGATETLTGYGAAIESALTKGIPECPQYNIFSRIFLDAFIGKAPDRVTLNALAILFAAFLVFDYTLQAMLVPGTSRSINCYNCATCVGACPVKEAEGVQMPMGLVLLTRLGDYERVLELSKYCVGCGRCAAKCPIGNSGPLVISAAFRAAHEAKKAKRLEGREESA